MSSSKFTGLKVRWLLFDLCPMPTPQLNFPEHPQRLRLGEKGEEIWDPIRKRFVRLTPEEWVRQSLRAHLVNDLHYPEHWLGVEQGLQLNGMSRRTDLRVYKHQKCVMLIECKAPEVAVHQKAFDQVCRYNLVTQAPWIVLTNGLQHIVAWVVEERPFFAEHIPHYSEL